MGAEHGNVTIWILWVVLGSFTVLAGYILKLRVKPLEKRIDDFEESQATKNEDLKREVRGIVRAAVERVDLNEETSKKIASDILKEIQDISRANVEFRVRYEKDLGELRLEFTREYPSRQTLDNAIAAISKEAENEGKRVSSRLRELEADVKKLS